MRAMVFVRRSGAMGLGHVGWAFEKSNDLFYSGSVENPGGKPVESPDKIGFWSIKSNYPQQHFVSRDYDEFKIINISGGNHVRAYSEVIRVKRSWYTLLFGNCMDDTFNVLRAYGVKDMPLPGSKITPNNWFDSLNWTHYNLSNLEAIEAPEKVVEEVLNVPLMDDIEFE
jgi:hypothetical protein